MEFKVGDRVKLSESGLVEFLSQSKGGSGTITEIKNTSHDFCIRVEWDVGHKNIYRESHLQLSQKKELTPFEQLYEELSF